MTLIVIDRLTITADEYATNHLNEVVDAPEKIYSINLNASPLGRERFGMREMLYPRQALAFTGHYEHFENFYSLSLSKFSSCLSVPGERVGISLEELRDALKIWAKTKVAQEEWETFSILVSVDKGVYQLCVRYPDWEVVERFHPWDEETTTMAFGGAVIGHMRSSAPWFNRVVESIEQGRLPGNKVERWFFGSGSYPGELCAIEHTTVKTPAERAQRKGGSRLKRYSAKLFRNRANA